MPEEVSCLLKLPTALGSNRAAAVPQVLECGSGEGCGIGGAGQAPVSLQSQHQWDLIGRAKNNTGD